MPAITIRKLSIETHQALKQRATLHKQSTEAEVRQILEEAVRPKDRIKIGSELAAFGQRIGEFQLSTCRDQATTEAAKFE